MCGIVGIVRSDGRPVETAEIERMTAMLVHRGPDEDGRYVAPGVGLGIRRLRIIDLVTGSQPIGNEDESVWTIQNGEIYNFQELRDELESKGHRFRTQSDTECIAHAYEEYGVDCVNHLRGMFAFAVWDARAKRLLLARDRLGKKPLVYAEIGPTLCFASEFQALLQLPEISCDLDLGALGDYLAYGYVPAPASIYRAVRKLAPGHRLVWEGGQARVERYWSLEYAPKLRLTEEDALVELERRLTEAIRLRLVADVSVGALLSGGVDSSTVVALMARLSPGRVKTFSVGFEDAAYDELVHARRVAKRCGTDHVELVVKPEAAVVLPTLVRHYGEPYADSSAIPTYYVSQLARQHVTVALNGDGGDETFAGYDRYRAMWLAEALRLVPLAERLLPVTARVIGAMNWLPSRFRQRGARFLKAAVLPPAQRHARWVTVHPAAAQHGLLRPELAHAIAERRSWVVERTFEAYRGLPLTDRMLATDVMTYLPNDLLVKMDIASMANSLEMRSPLLDQEVVEFAARLSVGLKLRYGVQQKYLLKRLARRLIPWENIDRPKMGFGVPVGEWLRGPLHNLCADMLLSADARHQRYVHAEVVERLWNGHQARVTDHTVELWTLLMLELWFREFGAG